MKNAEIWFVVLFWALTLSVPAGWSFAGEYDFSTFAGLGERGLSDGKGRQARFANPRGIAVDRLGNLYIADRGNACIRRVTVDGTVTLFAGSREKKQGCVDGPVGRSLFADPAGLAMDDHGTLYITDAGDHVIRSIQTNGMVTTIAGKPGKAGYADGTNGVARFNAPTGISADATGCLFVADKMNNVIRKVTPDGIVTTIAGKAGEAGSSDGISQVARFNMPTALCIWSNGTIFVTEVINAVVRQVGPDGVVRTLAGKAGEKDSRDGEGASARFMSPDGIAVDKHGVLYVVDRVDSTVRRITLDGTVTTLGGRFLSRSERECPFGRIARDGVGKEARFYRPSGIAVDEKGVLYITDSEEHTIRVGRPVK